jgi:hypothetical protein
MISLDVVSSCSAWFTSCYRMFSADLPCLFLIIFLSFRCIPIVKGTNELYSCCTVRFLSLVLSRRCHAVCTPCFILMTQLPFCNFDYLLYLFIHHHYMFDWTLVLYILKCMWRKHWCICIVKSFRLIHQSYCNQRSYCSSTALIWNVSTSRWHRLIHYLSCLFSGLWWFISFFCFTVTGWRTF